VKVLPFKIPKPENSALIYQVDRTQGFYDKLHQHEEIQISLILEGEGDLVVGDTISRYKKNDIVMIGENLPHLFRSDMTYPSDSHMLTLFFTKDSFGDFFFDLIELKSLNALFRKVDSGIRLLEHQEEVRKLFLELENASQLERFICFLKILNYFTLSKTESLSSFIYQKVYSEDEGVRMSNVMNYAINEFSKEIKLEKVADLANMTPNAFCRYFKHRTNKTFFQFLTEIRIENACRLIERNKDLSIAEASYQSGFKNMSNFNRKFRQYKGMTPTNYRKQKANRE